MPYNNVISRTDAAALIPTEVSAEIVKSLPASNPLLTMARRLPNMSKGTRTMPVMSALATAYFVNGDTGLKQTSEVNWTGVNIHAEELAAIVPIPEAVLDDADYDIWGEVRPAIEEALGVAIAQAAIVPSTRCAAGRRRARKRGSARSEKRSRSLMNHKWPGANVPWRPLRSLGLRVKKRAYSSPSEGASGRPSQCTLSISGTSVSTPKTKGTSRRCTRSRR